jgi:hypothetical protein
LAKTQNPKPSWGQPVIIEESRRRRDIQFPLPIRTLRISCHRLVYRGDSRSCRIIYPINGLHQPIVAGYSRTVAYFAEQLAGTK